MKKNILLIVLLIAVTALVSCTSSETGNTDNVQLPIGVEEDTSSSLDGADIVTLTDDNYHDVIGSSEGVAIVDFWAAWCGPCVQLAPILEEVSAEEGVTVYKVNVDENPKLSAEFKITGIPMVYIYKDGEIVATQLGLAPKATYVKHVNDNR